MSTNTYLCKRLREVLLDGRWIANTNFKEQVAAINREQAVARISGLNSIAVLVFHVNYYLAGLLNVMKGGKLEIRDQFSFDLPPIQTEGHWEKLVDEFLNNAEEFASAVERMPEERFGEPFVDAKYGTWLRNIEGVIEHCYYHLGQIVMLGKLVKKELVRGNNRNSA